MRNVYAMEVASQRGLLLLVSCATEQVLTFWSWAVQGSRTASISLSIAWRPPNCFAQGLNGLLQGVHAAAPLCIQQYQRLAPSKDTASKTFQKTTFGNATFDLASSCFVAS